MLKMINDLTKAFREIGKNIAFVLREALPGAIDGLFIGLFLSVLLLFFVT